MADLDSEQFANPIAPAGHKKQNETSTNAQPLTNDDFRKLIQTPRVGSATISTSVRKQHHEPSSVRGRKPVFPSSESSGEKSKRRTVPKTPRPQEDEYLAELAQRYRDRAKERREGANPDYQNDESATSATSYRAIPDLKSIPNVAERRKQMIEESKYLGGDMEHTHLVKGLDYALLQKVKAELHQQGDGDEEDDKSGGEDELKTDKKDDVEEDEESEDRYAIKSKMAMNIVNLINQKLPDRNELFLPQRMAYIVNLEDESFDDIPTTIIRSRAECSNSETSSSLTTNDIVMGKLIQIWSYLRQGGSKKQKLKQLSSSGTPSSDPKPVVKKENIDDSIYGDIGQYVPSAPKNRKVSKESKPSSSRQYFEKDTSNPEPQKMEQRPSTSKIMELVQDVHKGRSKLSNEPEGYAECYPGALENDDAVMDSDDEADYSKMDIGSKKGGVGRWDFETTEEYSDYMGKKEALPKAAYQFGVKMTDGRKSKKGGSEKKKDDNAKLDRDLQKINAILNRRKEEKSNKSRDD